MASIPEEFEHMSWKVNEAGVSSEAFDPSLLEVKIIPETLDYLDEGEEWFYIWNEATWNAAYDADHPDVNLEDDSSYAQTPLHRYLDRNPDEDRWCDNTENDNSYNPHYGTCNDHGTWNSSSEQCENITEWPSYCVQNWQ